MRNRRTWEVFLASLLGFGFLSRYLPVYRGGTDLLSLALSVTSILFGLLIGFFITQMWNKFSSIRRESAILRSALLEMISQVRRISRNEDVKKEFNRRMEKFLIAFIMVAWDSVEEEDRYFRRVKDSISEIKPVNDKDGIIYAELLDAERKANSARSQLSAIGKQSLMKLEWVVLISLSSIITVSVVLLRDGSLFFQALATLLPSLVILTMLILDDLDNLRWGASVISFEPAQAALDQLYSKPFYEKRFVEEGWLDLPEDYRTEEDLEGELLEVYEELKIKNCLRESGFLGPKL